MQRFQIAFRRKKLKICNNIGGLINSGFALLEVFSIPDPHYQRSFQFRIRTIPELSEVFSIPDPHYRRSFQFRISTNRGLSIPNPHYGKSHQFRIHTIGCLFNSGSALSPIGGLFNSGSALSEVWSITDLHYWRSFQIRIRTMKYLAFRSGVTSCRTVSRRPKKWPGVRRNWADPLEVPHVNIKDVAVREHFAFCGDGIFHLPKSRFRMKPKGDSESESGYRNQRIRITDFFFTLSGGSLINSRFWLMLNLMKKIFG